MKVAIISDVHGNRLALEAVLDDIVREGVDATFNLGDLFSGPLEPNWVADILMDLDLPTVRGNHERHLIDNPPDKLSRVELEGVLAHELSHIKNYDILVSTLAVTLVGVVTLLADFSLRFLWWGGPRQRNRQSNDSGGAGAIFAILGIVLLLIAPLIGKLMQLAVSRKREALADVSGVAITRYPPGLISALEKLRDDQTVVQSASKATAHLWIESPIGRTDDEPSNGRGDRSWLNKLFDTHPPLEERIAALREL